MPRYQSDFAQRPGTVTAIRGIVFQSDGRSTIGGVFIRPFEALDRWLVGILPKPGDPSLAMHAGIHIEIDGSSEYVVEQLVGSMYLTFKNGLNWTPLHDFQKRDRGGWDVTVTATSFRRSDDHAVEEAIGRLNRIEGHPFMGEDCTAFIERAFGGRRMFADSPLLRWLGIGARIGDPALPLFRPEPPPAERARRLLQFEQIRNLPDPLADADSLNAQLWAHRLIPMAILGGVVGRRLYSSSSRKSTPASRTARKFLR